MFERAAIALLRDPPRFGSSLADPTREFAFGRIAEALVFYNSVYLLLRDPNDVLPIVQRIGVSAFIELCSTNSLVLLLADTAGMAIGFDASREDYSFTMEYSPDSLHEKDLSFFDKTLKEHGYSASDRKKVLGTLSEQNRLLMEYEEVRRNVFNALLSQWANDEAAIQSIAKKFVSSIHPDWHSPDDFLVYDSKASDAVGSTCFRINSSFDKSFSPITHLHDGEFIQLGLSSRDLMTAMHRIAHQAVIGAVVGTEFIAGQAVTDALRAITERPLRDRLPNQEIQLFQEMVFPNGCSVSRAIDSKDRTFSDLIELLGKKGTFANWISGQRFEAGLANAYFDHVRRGTWLDRLPGKSFRFSLFTGAGLAADAFSGMPGLGTGAAVGLAAFDAFVLDRILKGWKPSHFVEGPLADFVEARA